jgi:hypothetical protein
MGGPATTVRHGALALNLVTGNTDSTVMRVTATVKDLMEANSAVGAMLEFTAAATGNSY